MSCPKATGRLREPRNRRATWTGWSVRLRALLLVLVWTLPGVWCVGHLVAHQLESGHPEAHAEFVTGDRGIELSDHHAHGHAHPESPSAVPSERVPDVNASVLLMAGADVDSSRPALRLSWDAAAGHAGRSMAAVSGPRAPPVS